MNNIVSDWDTLPIGVKAMTILGALFLILCMYRAAFNVEFGHDFVPAVLCIGYFGLVILIFPAIVSRAARARGGRMLKWYLFAFFVGVFFPWVGAIAVLVYYKFWCKQHPVVSTPKGSELVG